MEASWVHNISYRVDAGSWQEYSAPFTLSNYSHGTHTIYYYATDNAGNEEEVQQEEVFLDIEAPNITFELSEFYLNDTTPQYNDTELQINCSMEDDTTVQWVYLGENSTGAFLNRSMSYIHGNYTFTLDISALEWGDTIIFSFYANDIASNIRWENNGGALYSLPIKDSYTPNTTLNYQTIANPNYVSKSTQFSLSADDWDLRASGIQNITYQIDNESRQEYTLPFTLAGYNHGTHTISYYATDNEGNIESTHNTTIYLDIENGNTTIHFETYKNQSVQYVSNLTEFTLISNDGMGSGIKNINYSIDSEPHSNYTMNFTLNSFPEGFHNISFYSVDKAGNIEPTAKAEVYLDINPPELNLSYTTINDPYFVDENTEFYLTVADGPEGFGSGVQSIQYKIDSGSWHGNTTFRLDDFSLGNHIIHYRGLDNVGNDRVCGESVFLVANGSDLDGDNLTYAEEITHGADPLNNDTDNDGLQDGIEVKTYGTNPNDNDTDSDFMPDGWEIDNMLDPKNGTDGTTDMDSDGLIAVYEYGNGTNPNEGDMDNDQLLDGEELIPGADGYITDPNDNDTDSDLMPDGWEVEHMLDPTNGTDGTTDKDSDGLKALDEFNYGTDPNNSDTDGDGYNDGVEIAAGTDPLDETDHPSDPPSQNILGYPVLIILSVISVALIITAWSKKRLSGL